MDKWDTHIIKARDNELNIFLEEYKRIRNDITCSISDLFTLNKLWIGLFSLTVAGAHLHTNKSIVFLAGAFMMIIIQFIIVSTHNSLTELSRYCVCVESGINGHLVNPVLKWEGEVVKKRLAINTCLVISQILINIFIIFLLYISSWGLSEELERYNISDIWAKSIISFMYFLEAVIIYFSLKKFLRKK